MGKLVFLAECIFSWMSYNYNTVHKNARISEIIRMADRDQNPSLTAHGQ